MLEGSSRTGDRVATGLIWSAAASVTIVFAALLIDLLRRGLAGVDWAFLTSAPLDAGRSGGILPILVSTAGLLVISMVVAVPVGVGAAVWLSEYVRGAPRRARFVRRSLDVLAGVPSIVFGLFGSVFFCDVLGLGFSLLAGGLTLACMALPILIRTTESALRDVPDDYRLAAAALGMRRTTTLRHLILPAAAPGIAVGLVLGIGRALAETAALLFTSGYVDRMPTSVFDSGRSLSIHIYDLSMNVAGGGPNAFATAVVLMVVLLGTNVLVVGLCRRWADRRGVV